MTKAPYTPITDEERTKLVQAAIGNAVLFSHQVDPSVLTSVFMPLVFLSKDNLKWMEDNEIFSFYEYMSEAGPRSINGYPIFTSMHMLNKSDFEDVKRRILAAQEAIRGIV